MISCEMSIRLHSKSDMTSLACSTAALGSLIIEYEQKLFKKLHIC